MRAKGERNLTIRDEEMRVAKEEGREFTEAAREIAEQHGSTPQGIFEFHQELLQRIPKDRRERVEMSPDFTRLAVKLYNKGLEAAGIEDEMLLYYHFTTDEGIEGIGEERQIKATGISAIEQTKVGFQEGGIREGIDAFLSADNWERVAVHVAGSTPPEVVESLGENLLEVFTQRAKGWLGRSNSLGIREANIRNYYEIVVAKSDEVFKRTFQSRMPGIDIDEWYYAPKRDDEEYIPIGVGDKTLVLGPRHNPYLEHSALLGLEKNEEMIELAKFYVRNYGDSEEGREALRIALIARMPDETYQVMDENDELNEVVGRLYDFALSKLM